MPKGKKTVSSTRYTRQFERTVRRTGKWRGKTEDEYKKYVKRKKGMRRDDDGKKTISNHEAKRIYKSWMTKKQPDKQQLESGFSGRQKVK